MVTHFPPSSLAFGGALRSEVLPPAFFLHYRSGQSLHYYSPCRRRGDLLCAIGGAFSFFKWVPLFFAVTGA